MTGLRRREDGDDGNSRKRGNVRGGDGESREDGEGVTAGTYYSLEEKVGQ